MMENRGTLDRGLDPGVIFVGAGGGWWWIVETCGSAKQHRAVGGGSAGGCLVLDVARDLKLSGGG